MDKENLLLWDDNPSDVDLLGFEAISSPIHQALLRNDLDPVCVGVFGPWGSGKTTVVGLVRQSLENNDAVVAVYTQPWAYSPETDPKAMLIGEVLTAIRSKIESDDGTLGSLAERFTGLAKRIRWAKAIKLSARTALTAQLPSVDDLESLFGKADEITDPSLEGFRVEFEELLADEAMSGIERVVVMVDDLDRCLPETVVDTLEAIKLFLSVPKMAFLIAADEIPVTQAIAIRYGTRDQDSRIASRYLEKIVQIPVRVPALGRSDVEGYVGQLLLHRRFSDVPDVFESIRAHCAQRRASGERSLLDELDVHSDGVNADLALAARLAPILYKELDGNPRQIKRFLNAYWMRWAIANARGVSFEVAAFAKLMVLELLYPVAFRELLSWLSAGELPSKLAELEAEDNEDPSQLRKWAALEPNLAKIDVGPYLVLAASLSGETISDESLPGHLRELALQLVSQSDAVRKEAQSKSNGLEIGDRSYLAVNLAETIRFQPSRPENAAESLIAVINDDNEVASSALPSLRRIPHNEIIPALPIRLSPPGHTSTGLSELISEWENSEDVPEDTRRAAKMAIGG